MPVNCVEALREVEIDPSLAAALRLSPRLRLRRAWPRGAGHLLLELEDDGGAVVGGQWMADGEALENEGRRARGACPQAAPIVVAASGGQRLLLHGRGADRRLPALAGLLTRPATRLLGHRAGRRAVVRCDSPACTRYAKVLRPGKIEAIVERARLLERRDDLPFEVPPLAEWDPRRGIVVYAPLAGRSLHEMLDSPERDEALRRCGESLRELHSTTPDPEASRHDVEAEHELVERWIEHLRTFEPALAGEVGGLAEGVLGALAAGSSPIATLHRDLHDKQVFVDERGRIGLLDFDTLARGEAALDVANFLAHLELRALQGLLPGSELMGAVEAFLAGYDPAPVVLERVPPWLDATRLRLSGLYAFRPRWSSLPERILARAGAAISLPLSRGSEETAA